MPVLFQPTATIKCSNCALCGVLILYVLLIRQSATLDAEAFATYFETNESDDKAKNTAAITSVEGRCAQRCTKPSIHLPNGLVCTKG